MIKGQNIICFGSEKWEYQGQQQRVMRLLSKNNRILYVNSLGSRKISLRVSEFRFYFKKAINFFKQSTNKEENSLNNVIICNPRIIPLVYNNVAMQINKSIMKAQFAKLLSNIGFNNYILWAGTPTVSSFLDIFDPTVLIYNPVDRFSAFSFVDHRRISSYERHVASKADAIICTSDAIRRDLEPYNSHCLTVTHGVDVNHFHSALNNNDVPEDIRNIQSPIIGYFGLLNELIDWNLLFDAAIRYPDASIVLIGKYYRNIKGLAKLKQQPNVHFLGYKNYKVLPDYLKQFTVCLIPFIINELMVAVDPTKLREYLAQGKPVVSTDLPEVRKLQDVVYISENNQDFIDKIGKAIMEDDPSLSKERTQAAWRSDWGVKIDEISDIVQDAIARRESSNMRKEE